MAPFEFPKPGSSPVFLNPLNDLNVAKRLNDWNVWNGHQHSLAIERLERFEQSSFDCCLLPLAYCLFETAPMCTLLLVNQKLALVRPCAYVGRWKLRVLCTQFSRASSCFL